MTPPPRVSYTEVEALLNERDAQAARRRRHHLPPEEYRRTDVAFLVTLCARHHPDPFQNPALADAVVGSLHFRRARGDWKVYVYCLMPDHLHAVVQLAAGETGAPRKDLLQVCAEFSSITTRAAWKAGLSGRLWQRDQYDRLLRNDREFSVRCNYVLNNPVRKGLVEDWTQWPYGAILDDW